MEIIRYEQDNQQEAREDCGAMSRVHVHTLFNIFNKVTGIYLGFADK